MSDNTARLDQVQATVAGMDGHAARMVLYSVVELAFEYIKDGGSVDDLSFVADEILHLVEVA